MYVEFLGIPRERIGIAEVDTLGQVLRSLAARYPAFGELMAGDRLHASVAANLNGETFVSDPNTPLTRTDRLLILSADVGG